MQASLTIIRDELTPDLRARLDASANKRRIHMAIGMTIFSLAKRAFNQADLRAQVWPVKADGTPATLRKSGTMAKSIRVISATDSDVLTGSDRAYAAIHQLGGTTSPHTIRPGPGKKALKTPYGLFKVVRHPGSRVPARPYFPFRADGKPTARAQADIINTIDAAIQPRA